MTERKLAPPDQAAAAAAGSPPRHPEPAAAAASHLTNLEFLEWIAAPAVRSAARIAPARVADFAAVVMAQAALESGWGRSELFRRGRNVFGVKARDGEPFVELPTREYDGETLRIVRARFARYDSLDQAFSAHARLLNHSRYLPFRQARDWREACLWLGPERPCPRCGGQAGPDAEGTLCAWCGGSGKVKGCGYATDPDYAAKLIRLIETKRLRELAAAAEGGSR